MKERFEGWYYKHQQESLVLALIPGRSGDGAFVQVVTEGEAYHIPYPRDAFSEAPGGTVLVGENTFSPRGSQLHIRRPELLLQGELRYGAWSPLARDIMGPFRFFPMECRHRVHSMLHRVDGQVTLNGVLLNFDGGAGYVEGDSGRSFPSAYSWFQWMSLAKDASVMISVGRVPFAGLQFWGCIAVVWLRGREHRLATYLGARVRRRDERQIVLTQGKWTLDIEVLGNSAHLLRAPANGRMSRTIGESPAVPAQIRFLENRKVLLHETGIAGHEFVSDVTAPAQDTRK